MINPKYLSQVRLAVDLGAAECGGPLTEPESELVSASAREPHTPPDTIAYIRSAIFAGEDPLSDWFCKFRSRQERRRLGAFHTPYPVVRYMVTQCLSDNGISCLIDAGCGTGRFAAEAIRQKPDLPIVAVDIDPVATLLCRAHLSVMGGSSVHVLQGDYTTISLPLPPGRCAFIANPPYTRHHNLALNQKQWLRKEAEKLGIKASQLSGLHVHFFVATALHARDGDRGCFITSSEWLDTRYGEAIRRLLGGTLGGLRLTLLDANGVAFEDAMTTGVIIDFQLGSRKSFLTTRVVHSWSELEDKRAGEQQIPWSHLAASERWSSQIRRPRYSDTRTELIELGRIAVAHRGIATGANDFFLLTRETIEKHRLFFTRPAITSAQEVMECDGVIYPDEKTLYLLDIPLDLDWDTPQGVALAHYLKEGEHRGIPNRYLCRHRRPWWALRAGKGPPIVATYMARQPPVFALNPTRMICTNVVHGIYPKISFSDQELFQLVKCLNESRESFRGCGRTYNGALEKFEPSELERLPIKLPNSLYAKVLAEQGP